MKTAEKWADELVQECIRGASPTYASLFHVFVRRVALKVVDAVRREGDAAAAARENRDARLIAELVRRLGNIRVMAELPEGFGKA